MTQGLYVVASVGNLFLALVVAVRARRARGALPLALLCLSLFVWAVAEAAKAGGAAEPWRHVGLVGSSLAPAFLWHFLVAFLGRDGRASVAGLYAVAGAFAAGTAAALAWPAAARVVDGPLWNVAYLVVLFPILVASFVLVLGRFRSLAPGVERNAAGFVAAGIAVGAAAGFTELVAFLEPAVPRLGHLGSATAVAILAIAIFRHRLLADDRPLRDLFLALLFLAASGVVVGAMWRPGTAAAGLVAGTAGAVAVLAVSVRMRERAERRERLALLGTMAAGVAHEIKNPLAAIKGAAQFVEKEIESAGLGGEARDYLRLVVGEVDRLNAVVESLLIYARPLEPRRQDVDVPSLLGNVVRLQSATFPPSLRVETVVAPDLPRVPADPGLLTVAVLNLVRNAADAMPDGGTMTVVARPLSEGVAVEVADTGPGIPRDQLRRIFEPFVTTKAKGSGLGLPIARRIAEAHGGELRVENLSPRGCRFSIVIPASLKPGTGNLGL